MLPLHWLKQFLFLTSFWVHLTFRKFWKSFQFLKATFYPYAQIFRNFVIVIIFLVWWPLHNQNFIFNKFLNRFWNWFTFSAKMTKCSMGEFNFSCQFSLYFYDWSSVYWYCLYELISQSLHSIFADHVYLIIQLM